MRPLEVLLVDGMNVIGARPTGWWKDRPGAVRALVEDLGRYAAEAEEELTVVFDGPPVEFPADLAARVKVEFAPRGAPGAADDAIVELLEGADGSGSCVVTSDADLAARARASGASVLGAGSFQRRLDRHRG